MEKVAFMGRYWINQPSGLQPLHKYHGMPVLAPEKLSRPTTTIYPTSGSVVSMVVPTIVLSKGWKNQYSSL